MKTKLHKGYMLLDTKLTTVDGKLFRSADSYIFDTKRKAQRMLKSYCFPETEVIATVTWEDKNQ